MKLRVPCMQCFQEQGHPSDELMSVELRDDGLLNVTCSNGHSTLTAIQEQKYELLFELAVMALLDGYPREAATGMAASLERFYEFAIRVLCAKHGINDSDLTTAWKSVVNQSERQFGAFIFAFMLESGVMPATIDEAKPAHVSGQDWKVRTWKDFRNSVVHKGYMPSTSEAMAYGELVFNYIKELTIWLSENRPESFSKAAFSRLALAHTEAAGRHISTMSIPTILSTTREGFASRSFPQAVEELKQYKPRMHHP